MSTRKDQLTSQLFPWTKKGYKTKNVTMLQEMTNPLNILSKLVGVDSQMNIFYLEGMNLIWDTTEDGQDLISVDNSIWFSYKLSKDPPEGDC